MDSKRERLFMLFKIFLKIGAFTFGGGYAMIPFIQREVVTKHHYINEEEILEIVAISESTPGPIAVNSATFVGYRVAGVAGATVATLGIVLPSFIIILAISYVLQQFEHLEVVKYAFNGVRVAVLALVLNALITLYKQCPKGWISYGIMLAAFVAVACLKVGVIVVIIASATIGLASYMLGIRGNR